MFVVVRIVFNFPQIYIYIYIQYHGHEHAPVIRFGCDEILCGILYKPHIMHPLYLSAHMNALKSMHPCTNSLLIIVLQLMILLNRKIKHADAIIYL